ncbi:hypothetical protein KR032_002723 [Drosophila birchii]|nr:hypothetical protein KR032_002723 [Drosophila birchii]
MGSTNITELIDDCLYNILEFLPTEDRICFAQVCQRFRQVFINQFGVKYRDFTIDENSPRLELIQLCICRETVETLTINLDHFDTGSGMRTTHKCNSPVECYGILCHTLSGMNQLNHLAVKQLKFYIAPIDKPFDQVLAAVRHLPELKRLELQTTQDFSVDHLHHLQNLETLQLLIPKVPPTCLVKCFKSNGSLQSLHLGYACCQKNLVNIIVNHCKNLITLKFGMTGESADYKPLARLSKLRELSHFGIRRSGSFEPLLAALAAKSQLTHLSIDGGSLTHEEAYQLVRIQSLRHLTCFCASTECVEMLSRLTNLEEICLWMSRPLDISHGLLTIIASCKELRLLRLAVGNVNKNFFNDAIDLLRMGEKTGQQPALKLEIPVVCQKQDVSHQDISIQRDRIKWGSVP